MNEFNAIRISDKIEKVYIDFSSFESLKESSGFSRLYTIHTQDIIDISDEVGFHVGGFCDDRGNKESEPAEKISGYDYVPSDMILCLMDYRYNFLPLSKKQLDILYNYLINIYK